MTTPAALQQLLSQGNGEYGVIILPNGVIRRLLIPAPVSPIGTPAPGTGLHMEAIAETLEDNWYRTGTSATFGISKMLNAIGADKVVLYVISTLDQAVTIQTVGSYVDQPENTANLVSIGSSFSQSAGSTAQSINSIEVYLNRVWHPYLGITITTGAVAVTAGKIQVLARGQRWVA